MIFSDSGILILAAGSSSRLGRPKQLLTWKGKPLLGHVYEIAAKVCPHATLMVLGAHFNSIKARFDLGSHEHVFNEDWNAGMGSSIILGLNKLLDKKPFLKSVIISVADQPFLTENVFESLLLKHQKSKKKIIYSQYDIGSGVPALFDSQYFPSLLSLKKDVGAKALIKDFYQDATSIRFDKGNLDIDVEDDYKRALKLGSEI